MAEIWKWPSHRWDSWCNKQLSGHGTYHIKLSSKPRCDQSFNRALRKPEPLIQLCAETNVPSQGVHAICDGTTYFHFQNTEYLKGGLLSVDMHNLYVACRWRDFKRICSNYFLPALLGPTETRIVLAVGLDHPEVPLWGKMAFVSCLILPMHGANF